MYNKPVNYGARQNFVPGAFSEEGIVTWWKSLNYEDRNAINNRLKEFDLQIDEYGNTSSPNLMNWCTTRCKIKYAAELTACASIPDPVLKVICIANAEENYERCKRRC